MAWGIEFTTTKLSSDVLWWDDAIKQGTDQALKDSLIVWESSNTENSDIFTSVDVVDPDNQNIRKTHVIIGDGSAFENLTVENDLELIKMLHRSARLKISNIFEEDDDLNDGNNHQKDIVTVSEFRSNYNRSNNIVTRLTAVKNFE